MRAALLFILCLIAFTQAACARRTSRGVRLPFVAGAAQSHKPARSGDAANRVRDAISSLKDRVESEGAVGVTDEGSQAVPPAPGPAAHDPKGVGTSGSLSVENRYPTPPGASSSGPQPGHRVLGRAGAVVQRAGGASWLAMLCLIAGALVIALVLRRSRTTT